MNCSPQINNNSYTCYSKDQLVKMAQEINKKKKSNVIKISNNTKKELWNQIYKSLFHKCKYEWCWLDTDIIKNIPDDDLHSFTFRPKKPKSWLKDKHTWLTTTDINDVMEQYEKKYKDFKFFGPVPVDCPTGIYCELSNLNLKKMKNDGIKKLGIIFNLDKHNEPGSHWVGLIVNEDDKKITYYDSVGNPPPHHIQRFVKLLKNNFKVNRKLNFIFEYNKKKHQYGGSECGIYSMNFLVESLKGMKLADFQKIKISDFSMNILRDYFYRSPK